jgi:SPP1 family predicted phage head-tail adaptor
MSQISAGLLACRVIVQETVWQKDGLGAPHRKWIDGIKLWASIEPVNARDKVISQQMSAEVTHLITVRFHKLFAEPLNTSAFRLTHGKRAYRINGMVNDSNRNVVGTIHATEMEHDDEI